MDPLILVLDVSWELMASPLGTLGHSAACLYCYTELVPIQVRSSEQSLNQRVYWAKMASLASNLTLGAGAVRAPSGDYHDCPLPQYPLVATVGALAPPLRHARLGLPSVSEVL